MRKIIISAIAVASILGSVAAANAWPIGHPET
jgi:hypothetical protein